MRVAVAKLFSARARRTSRVVSNRPDHVDDPALPSAVADAVKGRPDAAGRSSTDYELGGARLRKPASARMRHIPAARTPAALTCRNSSETSRLGALL